MLPSAIADDGFSVFAILSIAGAAGNALGKTKAGNALSGPVCAMALTFALTASSVLPAPSPTVSAAQLMAVQLATPLLLFSADLRAIGRRAGRLVPSFFLGTIGTVLGAVFGLRAFSGPLAVAFGTEGLKAAVALAAKNIGGGLNFVAVAAALRLSPAAFAAALAVDNVMALVYFPLCAWLGRSEGDPFGEAGVPTAHGASQSQQAIDGAASTEAEVAPPLEVDRVSIQSRALAAALTVAAASQAIALRVAPGFDLPIATLITVAAATLVPRALAPLVDVGTELGTTCIFLFFATAGWTGGRLGASLLIGGPPLLGFLTVLYAIHLAIVLGVGALARRVTPAASAAPLFRLPLLLVSSNANIGGPATASALAVGNGWRSLVTPALLVGNSARVTATVPGTPLRPRLACPEQERLSAR